MVACCVADVDVVFLVFLKFGVVDDEIGVGSDKLIRSDKVISVGAATPKCRGSATYRSRQSEHECNANDLVLAQIRSESGYRSDIDDYVTAPITCEGAWKSFMNSLQVFTRPLDVMETPSKLRNISEIRQR